MKKQQELLEVVDENENVIGLEPRDKIHSEGLLHREIHIWFVTPRGEIIFQHRAKDKDTYPDKLDATVGGHVGPGMSCEEAAVKECKEETGIDIDLDRLVFLAKMKTKSFDETTNKINNTFRSQYAYLYDGSVNNLSVEDGESQGFEIWGIDKLSNLSDRDKNKFIPLILSEDMLSLFKKARTLLLK